MIENYTHLSEMYGINVLNNDDIKIIKHFHS